LFLKEGVYSTRKSGLVHMKEEELPTDEQQSNHHFKFQLMLQDFVQKTIFELRITCIWPSLTSGVSLVCSGVLWTKWCLLFSVCRWR